MNFEEYQEFALRTSAGKTETSELWVTTSLIALFGEVGEFANMYKKLLRHGHEYSEEEFSKELGDILWYLADISSAFGFNLADIAEQNIDKLRDRYPRGFSILDSKNRKEYNETLQTE